MHGLKIVLFCFRFVAIPTSIITIFSVFLLWQSGNPLFVVNLFWTKLATTALLLLFVHFFKSNEFYFFYNLGFDTKRVYTSMAVPDFLIATLAYMGTLLML